MTKIERRCGKDRRVENLGSPTGHERRSGRSRRRKLKIPIFLKFILALTLVILVVITTISYYMLKQQKTHFTDQLISLRRSLARITAEQAPDKILAEEDLTLFQLVKNVTAEKQVVFALIADSKNKIKAHSKAEKINQTYQAPEGTEPVVGQDGVRISTITEAGEELLFFEKPITFQKINVGTVALAISQKKIQGNIQSAKGFVWLLSLVIVIIGMLISFFLGLYFSNPILRLKNGTEAISVGDFEHRVQIFRNDELGDLGHAFNQMSKGLKERNSMQQSLELAMQVQQNLLPQEDPVVKGLDVSGRSIYCDETGGDYFDFLHLDGNHRLGVVLGDISGHGIPSALLMATARAFIRQRSAMPGDISDIVQDVNRLLCKDVMESNSFMTLFYLSIDPRTRNLRWVRAGHDPALSYHPETDTFEEFVGSGIPIGVEPEWVYSENEKTGMSAGQIIVLSTDGIRETFNRSGEMFGKQRIFDAIRQSKDGSARDILESIIGSVDRFREGLEYQDDITLVAIKFTG